MLDREAISYYNGTDNIMQNLHQAVINNARIYHKRAQEDMDWSDEEVGRLIKRSGITRCRIGGLYVLFCTIIVCRDDMDIYETSTIVKWAEEAFSYIYEGAPANHIALDTNPWILGAIGMIRRARPNEPTPPSAGAAMARAIMAKMHKHPARQEPSDPDAGYF